MDMDITIGNMIQIVATTGVVASIFWMGKYKLNGLGERTKRMEKNISHIQSEQIEQGKQIASLQTSLRDYITLDKK